MTAVAAVLLVPTEAHREALIGDGPCGSRAPVVWRYPKRGPDSAWLVHGGRPGPVGGLNHVEHALVLAWDGKPVADGLARLARFFPIVSRASIFPETMASVIALARRAEAPLGRVVLLDAAVPETT